MLAFQHYNIVKIFAKEEDLKWKSDHFPVKGMNSNWDQTPNPKTKVQFDNKHGLKLLFPLRFVVKQFSAWVLILLSFLLSLMWMSWNNFFSWKKCSYFFLFVLSPLSFVDTEHWWVKKDYKVKEGPKDRVILRIAILSDKIGSQFLKSISSRLSNL